jgi:hypothetical protein
VIEPQDKSSIFMCLLLVILLFVGETLSTLCVGVETSKRCEITITAIIHVW